MNIVVRKSLAISGGAIISIGLTFVMMEMIAVDFKAETKSAALNYEINPVEQIEEPEVREIDPPLLVKVDVPPPPPTIDTVDAQEPDVDIVAPGDPIPDDYLPPDLDLKLKTITVADSNPQPILRIPGQMPPRASRSGHCKLVFSVGVNGQPFDVQTRYCTQDIFKRPSIKAAQRFKYRPKIQNGQAVTMHGVHTQITYRLTDEAGRVIPE